MLKCIILKVNLVASSQRGCKLDEFKLVGLHEKPALKPGILQNNIYKFYSYLTDNS
jgi:hypothetical protein